MKVPPLRSALLFFFAMALCAAPIQAGESTTGEASLQASEFHRGVSYVHSWRGAGGYGTSTSAQSLAFLRSNHVGWIALNPFGYQSTLGDTSIRTAYDRRGAETDVAMAKDIAAAHELGLRVMLKPHLWISNGEWPGDVAFQNDEDWTAWFDSYERMILHYAEFARRT
ncbi:hypothetical protein IIC65_00335, partial [Candidatus Sumerlaeota bacterium]|nr:hypothetical protein [Candidatus Sumerlaeota bacterium]